jgi:hypothetical protein
MAVSLLLAALAPPAIPRASAYPLVSPPPHNTATPVPSPTPANEIPYGTLLTFVLDDPMSSKGSHAGQIVDAHLKTALVIDGHLVAPAGTPERIRILDALPASNPDVYGYLDVYFDPMSLPGGSVIPLQPPTSHLTVDVSAGHQSTVAVEDTIGDIFIPGHFLYHIFRKGRDFTMQPGAQIRARTEATVMLRKDGTIAVTTPAPIVMDSEMPVSTFTAMPFATPHESFKPLPRGRTTLPPSPTPQPAPPSPASSSAPSASPTL